MMSVERSGGTSEESEAGLQWMLQTAQAFLGSISLGEEEGGLVPSALGLKDQGLQSALQSDFDHIGHGAGNLSPFVAAKEGAPDPLTSPLVIDVRAWRPAAILEPILFVSSHRKSAMALVSFIGFQDQSRRRRKGSAVETNASFLHPIVRTTKAISYAHLLELSDSDTTSSASGSSAASSNDESEKAFPGAHFFPPVNSYDSYEDTITLVADAQSTSGSESGPPPYDPYFLDDPELRTGKHKTGSISHYTRKEDLKKELNEQFRQTHPSLDPSLSLSKIRNLKTAMTRVAESHGLELSSVAKAFVFFEKLCLRDLVNKVNRKLVGACCFLLAVKANDSKQASIAGLLEALEGQFDLQAADILAAEFLVFAALQFNLYPPQPEFMPHLERILTSLDYSNVQEYLGERMYVLWKSEQQQQ